MKPIVVAITVWALLLGSAAADVRPDPLVGLLDGNRRFAAGQTIHPNQDTARRVQLAGAQRPFAVIVGCSDSRVPPEVVFDQGLGDVFVVRVAVAQLVDPPGHP